MVKTVRRSGRGCRAAERWPRSLHMLCSPAQIRQVLERERARAERLGMPVSAVVFDLVDQARLRRMARLVLRNSRVVDECGLLSHGRICAVVPHSDALAADAFGRRIRQLASHGGMEVAFRVYTWTMDGPPDQGDADGSGSSVVPLPARERPPINPAAGCLATISQSRINALPLESLTRRPMPHWKRAMDIAGAALGLVVAAPLMLLLAALIRICGGGPAIFRQRRVGLGGSKFTIYKFRTMIPGADQVKSTLRKYSEQDGPAFKMTCDPRVTAIGRFLRTTSLDELPQLWNILTGCMSLVGPRPLPVEEACACQPWHRRRLDVTPGLTCIWQVRGRSRVGFDQWMRMDMEYIRNRSLLQDLKILLLTVPAVILRRGAH